MRGRRSVCDVRDIATQLRAPTDRIFDRVVAQGGEEHLEQLRGEQQRPDRVRRHPIERAGVVALWPGQRHASEQLERGNERAIAFGVLGSVLLTLRDRRIDAVLCDLTATSAATATAAEERHIVLIIVVVIVVAVIHLVVSAVPPARHHRHPAGTVARPSARGASSLTFGGARSDRRLSLSEVEGVDSLEQREQEE